MDEHDPRGDQSDGAARASRSRSGNWSATCPICSSKLRIEQRAAGQQLPCPGCGQLLQIHFFVEPVAPVEAPPRSFADARNGSNFASPFQKEPPTSASSTPPPRHNAPQPDPIADASPDWDAEPLPASPYEAAPLAPLVYEPEENGSGPDEYLRSLQPTAQRTARAVSGAALISPRTQRYLFVFGICFFPVILFLFRACEVDTRHGASGGAPFGWLCLAVLWFKFGWLIAYLLTPTLLAAFNRSVRCPGCAEQFPAVGVWHCGCGYHDHRERNLFLFKCPQCRKRIGHFNCPKCDATVLV